MPAAAGAGVGTSCWRSKVVKRGSRKPVSQSLGSKDRASAVLPEGQQGLDLQRDQARIIAARRLQLCSRQRPGAQSRGGIGTVVGDRREQQSGGERRQYRVAVFRLLGQLRLEDGQRPPCLIARKVAATAVARLFGPFDPCHRQCALPSGVFRILLGKTFEDVQSATGKRVWPPPRHR